MAIDTPSRRKSCIGLSLDFLRPGIIPDGANLAASERLHADYLYSGIAAAAPGGATLMAMERAYSRRIAGRIFGRVN